MYTNRNGQILLATRDGSGEIVEAMPVHFYINNSSLPSVDVGVHFVRLGDDTFKRSIKKR